MKAATTFVLFIAALHLQLRKEWHQSKTARYGKKEKKNFMHYMQILEKNIRHKLVNISLKATLQQKLNIL